MTRRAPAFPPDVAAALQRSAGQVSVRYTLPGTLRQPPSRDLVLMITPYERVLASIVLDTKLNVRFVRTGSREEGARVALTSVSTLFETGSRHWDIALGWTPAEIAIEVRDHHAPGNRPGAR